MQIMLDIPDNLLAIYQEYAKLRGCSLRQALLVPIESLAPVMAMSNSQFKQG